MCHLFFFFPVKYIAVLDDEIVIAKTSEEGVEFHVKDGNL